MKMNAIIRSFVDPRFIDPVPFVETRFIDPVPFVETRFIDPVPFVDPIDKSRVYEGCFL